MKNILCWIADRMKEPSSDAAAGCAVVGLGVLIDQPGVILAGALGGAIGCLLKERGDI